jgi:hypothetical protein
MNIPYSIEVYDNLIDSELQSKILDYVQEQEWHQVWLEQPEQLTRYRPNEGHNWFTTRGFQRGSSMHRCVLAEDEAELKSKHLPVYLLWKELNRKLDNKFELIGEPEGVYDSSKLYRAYVNASHNTQVLGYGYAHRDNSNLDDDTSVTMLYVLNAEWYPSWGAELRFYPEDPAGLAKDYQQFNIGREQRRGYNIGWLDQGRIVSPVPGRLIVYDGRCLHGTSPSADVNIDNPSIKLAFRARRIVGNE